ncbi:cytochrome b-245 chaperone 1 isoform 2-T4 [Megaptera novaeangliae]
MYMQVETRTSSYLHLKRAPGIRSWSLLVDSLGWKLFYVTGCLFVAVQNLEDWEEAVFNKSTGKVVLKTFSLYRKLLTLCRAGHDQVVVLLSDIRDVNVEEEKVRYFGKGYVVVLRFATGFSHPLTQSAVMGHRSSWLCPWKPQGRTLSRSCCLLLSSEQNHSGTFSAGSEGSRGHRPQIRLFLESDSPLGQWPGVDRPDVLAVWGSRPLKWEARTPRVPGCEGQG